MVNNDVSRYQYNPSYQREVTQTERVNAQERAEEPAEARRADSVENRPQARLSYLGSNFDTYA